MDIIQQCLSIAPVAFLAPAFSTLQFIWSSVEQVPVSKKQLTALAQSIAQLLQTLDGEHRTGRQLQTRTSTPLDYLNGLLVEILAFVQKIESSAILKLLFTKDQRIARIEGYYQRINMSIELFEIPELPNIHAWLVRNDDARRDDQQILNGQLDDLEKNLQRLKETLNMHQNNDIAIIASLKRRLDQRLDGDRERQFFLHSLRYLTASTGHQVVLQNWMITSYEVEFGQKIGSGGFGQVFMGTWNNTEVAVKVLATEDGAMPSSAAIRQEIDTWSMLKHPHVLQFLGANDFDNRPFVVMPYMKNGNARDYVRAHPDCNKLWMIHHISLGLVYLHSKKIVHGDLKALNVLIDGSGKAVLCDFGLSRIKADTSSRTARSDGHGIVGSRNWMAPEQLLGRTLKLPCDIYAFGMTLYEIFTNEIPMGHINYPDFIELVAQRDVRPEKPEHEDAPQLTNAVWALAEKCWVKDPKQRPTAGAVCDDICLLLNTTSIAQQTSTPSPLHLIALSESAPLPHGPVQASAPHALTPALNLTIRGHADRVYCAAFSPDGKYIVTGSCDHTIMVWNGQTTNSVLGPLKKHTASVHCVAFSPDGKQIASGSGDDTILVWDAMTGKVVAGPIEGHDDIIWAISFSPDGEKIVSSSGDKTIRVWDAHTGATLVGPLKGHSGGVTSVAFTGDGKQLASGSHDKTVRVWDVTSGSLIHEPLRGPKNHILFVAFSPDGKRIVAASWDGDVCIWESDNWDTEEGTLVSGPSKHHAEGALAVAFRSNSTTLAVSPDGKWITGYQERDRKTVYVWDSNTGQSATTFQAVTVSFSPDSDRILSTSYDTIASGYVHIGHPPIQLPIN